MLVTAARDGAVMVWDTRCAGVTFDRNGSNATAFGAANVIRHAHTPITTSGSRRSGVISAPVVSVSGAIFAGDRTVISAGSFDGCLRAWDVRMLGRHNSKVHPIPIHQSVDLTHEGRLGSRRFGLTHLCLDPTHNEVYTVGMNGHVYAVNGTNLQPLRIFGSDQDPSLCVPSHYTRVSVHPLGEWIAVGSMLHHAVIWDAQRPTIPPILLTNGHAAEISNVTFSQSTLDVQIATCSDDTTVRIWKESQEDADHVASCRDGFNTNSLIEYKSWGYAAPPGSYHPIALPAAWDFSLIDPKPRPNSQTTVHNKISTHRTPLSNVSQNISQTPRCSSTTAYISESDEVFPGSTGIDMTTSSPNLGRKRTISEFFQSNPTIPGNSSTVQVQSHKMSEDRGTSPKLKSKRTLTPISACSKSSKPKKPTREGSSPLFSQNEKENIQTRGPLSAWVLLPRLE
jgi:hypothetical protein